MPKGKKKKQRVDGGSDTGGQEPKKNRPRAPRRSLGRTIERMEQRRKAHKNRVIKKTKKLRKRLAFLEGKGVHYPENFGVPLGDRHRRAWRAARRKEIVGPPVKKWQRKPKEVKKPEEKADGKDNVTTASAS